MTQCYPADGRPHHACAAQPDEVSSAARRRARLGEGAGTLSAPPSFTALVLAGSRAGGDPLAAAAGVAHKALAAVADTPMLARVLTTLQGACAVGRVVVCGFEPELAAAEPALRAIAADRPFEVVAGGATPATSVALAIETLALAPPLLVTTADHPLLSVATVDEFCAGSLASDGDVSFGVVRAEAVAARFPGIRRTRFRFRDGAWCGCNLFALLTPAGCTAPALWRRVESHRKRPWRIVGALGPVVLLRFLFGRLALHEVTALGQRQLGLRAQPVQLTDPAAGFDVDTVEQRAVADAYLRRGDLGR